MGQSLYSLFISYPLQCIYVLLFIFALPLQFHNILPFYVSNFLLDVSL